MTALLHCPAWPHHHPPHFIFKKWIVLPKLRSCVSDSCTFYKLQQDLTRAFSADSAEFFIFIMWTHIPVLHIDISGKLEKTLISSVYSVNDFILLCEVTLSTKDFSSNTLCKSALFSGVISTRLLTPGYFYCNNLQPPTRNSRMQSNMSECKLLPFTIFNQWIS